MAHKLQDIAVKTGEYTNAQGETKGRYENIGSLMQGDDGQFLILKRTFNIAGVPNPENKDSVIASLFEPKQQGQQQGNQAPHQNNQPQQGGYNQQQGGYQGQQNNNQGGYGGQPQQGGYQGQRG